MPGDDWQRVWDLFHRAVELEEAQREAFVIEQCGEDIPLHDEVMSLIESRNHSDDFLENPPHPDVGDEDVLPGHLIGHYRLEAVIGSGGMGTVYLARDESELKRPVALKEIKRGMVIAAPGSVTPHTEFKAEVYVLKKDEGGRHTPFFNNYRPQFFMRTTDVTGETQLPENVEMVMPGDNVTISVKLITPVALEKGLRFAIREGGRTVGAGQVIEVIN